MNTQTEAATSVFDVVKQVFSVVFVIAGIAAFYHFSDIKLIYRVIGLLAVLSCSIAMIATTVWGRTYLGYAQDYGTNWGLD